MSVFFSESRHLIGKLYRRKFKVITSPLGSQVVLIDFNIINNLQMLQPCAKKSKTQERDSTAYEVQCHTILSA